MNHPASKLLYAIILVVLCLFGSCKKNVAGPKGDAGTPGKNGNLGQYSTSSINQPDSAWSLLADGKSWESLLYVPDITNKVILEGEVDVFIQKGASWYCLPHVEEEDLFIQYRVQNGSVLLNSHKMHGPWADSLRPLPMSFRVVVFSPLQ